MTGQQPDPRAAARELGAALRSLQQQSGRPLRSLEDEVRISDSSLSRYFRGETVPPWPAVRDLCRALKADPVPYRVLWEATESTTPDEPDAAANASTAPVAAAGGVDPSHVSGPAWWRRWPGPPGLRGRLTGRGAIAAVAVAGALVTVGLLVLLFPSRTTPDAASAAQSAQERGAGGSAHAGVLVHNVERACQRPRTTPCALSLAYNPYRPYNTANSAGRVWHHDLLRAVCTIANGVSVTDENLKHTSIWIQITRNGERLWLPGIRVHPDHLIQLTTVLPACTP
ncbi:helix-turn-helix domain-containing protein [Streptomyces sp. NPDC102282]|uniref:helix-turn-helix domain-containing protein n=1 Tax=Streptomyces sp. NPDC102282 TaxID=3366154 RepID=UPI00380B0AC4